MSNQEFQTVYAILRDIANEFSDDLQDAQTLAPLNFDAVESFTFEAIEGDN